jgi:DNA repair protein RadC
MTSRIVALPIDEQPCERLAQHGVRTLSDAELVSVLGVDVLDHLILGAGRYVSLKQRDMM